MVLFQLMTIFMLKQLAFFSEETRCNQQLPAIISRPDEKHARSKRLHKGVNGDHCIRQHIQNSAETDPHDSIIGENREDRHRADGRHVNEDRNDQIAFQFGEKNGPQTGGDQENDADQKFVGFCE